MGILRKTGTGMAGNIMIPFLIGIHFLAGGILMAQDRNDNAGDKVSFTRVKGKDDVFGDKVSFAQWKSENTNAGDSVFFSRVKTRDGKVLIGKVMEQSGSSLTFRENVLGTLTIPMKKVKDIQEEDTSKVYLVMLVNGNELYGKIVSKAGNEFELKTKMGLVSVKDEWVKDIEKLEIKSILTEDYWFPNPNATRYFFAPTAIPLKKGDGYYQNAYLLANMANYGMNDYFSFGGGVVLPVAAFITPKVGFKIAKNFYAGGGMLLGLLPETNGAGIMYGLTTYGNIEHNITAGIGYGLMDGEFTQRPIITLNAMTRTSRKTALVTENWIVPLDDEYQPLFSYGARFMWNRFTIDGAFLNNRDIFESFIIGIPYIDFVVKF